MITITINCDPHEFEAHIKSLGFMRNPVAALGASTKRPTVSELETLLKGDNGPPVYINTDGSVGTVDPGPGTPLRSVSPDPGPSQFADEMSALENPADLAAPAAETTSKRVPGQPSPGRKRRTAAEVAEDLAHVSAQPTAAHIAAISTGEERRDPAAEAQDAADEAAETAARANGKLTLEDVRRAVAKWSEAVGPARAVKELRDVIGCAIIELPEDKWAKAISDLEWAAAPSIKHLNVPNGTATAPQPPIGTKEEVIAAVMAYGKKYDGATNPDLMAHTKEDLPHVFTKVFGDEVTGIGSMPKGSNGQPAPEACGKIIAAIMAATRDNLFKREVKA